ncbi:hypothetical protein BX265_6166 [Streptomyces sp. TLI_235]|nr:protein transporter Sec31 [Streptomyces sp. TLI_235]PBC71556.1 hypothetical protein BX265_6166 [Streptomyces sp. TLI_235]
MAKQHPTHLIPHTIDGHTEWIPADQPRAPHDWDRAAMRAVAAATALILAIAITWSTGSIGDLLTRVAHPAIAYGAAAVFDLAWIVFMTVEWLSRYNPARAVLPRRLGWAALVVAMAAVCTHGVLDGGRRAIAAGIIGSTISALAKTVWTVAIRHTAKPLDRRTQLWVDRRMADAGARLALAGVHRQLAHLDTQWATTLATLPPAVAPTPDPDGNGPDPDKPSGQPDTTTDQLSAAVRVALATMPDATPEDIAQQLEHAGFDGVTADAVRALSGQPDSRSATLHDLAERRGLDSMSDTIRRLVRDGITDPDTVIALVKFAHGEDIKEPSVRRILSRFAG